MFSDDYHLTGGIDTYDPATGLYFKAVRKPESGGRGLLGSSKQSAPWPINVAVFDPSTQQSRLLFQEPPAGTIGAVIFETAHNDGSITFTSDAAYRIKNNENVPMRELKSKVLVVVTAEDRKSSVLFFTQKNKGVPVALTTVPQGVDWHIDVKNSKVRIVRQTGQDIQVESHDW